jgi:hypothetical protein
LRILRCLTVSTLATTILACDHTAPFTTADYASTTPLVPGNPARLTYDTGTDSRPSWLPDGSAFLYTQEQIGRSDDDRCLAVMPKTGGTVIRTICTNTDAAGDTLNDFESPAVSTTGQMAYVRTSVLANVNRVTPDYGALVLATYTAPLSTTVLEPLSYFAFGHSVDMVADLAWVSPSALLFVAEQLSYPCANFGCTRVDTVVTGLDVERIDVTSGGSVITLVTGTGQATSLAAGGPDTIYYTVAGDAGVHRRLLTTSADTVVFTFGAVPTDVTVAGNLMAVVVGSDLHVVNLQSGTDTPITMAFTHLHHPALSPDRHLLVAEVAAIDSVGAEAPPDLWLWSFP